jgi:hypothetical protein
MAGSSLNDARGAGGLTLNDLADLEGRYGTLSAIDFSSFSVLRSILWLSLRKGEPGLTEEQVGDRFNLGNLATEVQPILVASGLAAAEDDASGKAAAV